MYEIRKARVEDLPRLGVFQKELHGEWFASGHSDLEQSVPVGHVWIAMEGDTAIGYQLCELFDSTQKYFPNSVFLSELFVTPDHRRQGVGSHLIETALNEHWPKMYGYFSLTHDPDEPHLTKFYEKFGFEVRGKTDVGNIKMIRPR